MLGPVFRTYEPTRDRLVAVKVFRLDLTPEQAQALADELQRVVDLDLDHPSIVRPIAAGVEGSSAYYATEYVAAESLDVALRHYAPAAMEKVLPFITQLAGAIDFARTAGVGHGALHPRDIFVTPEEARATGFGVVQALEGLGVRSPTRRPYTAPERVGSSPGDAWDVRADVYALAAIAYELITGKRPVGSEVGDLGATAGPYADHVAFAVARGLSEEPGHRYESALAFAAAIEAASRGERTTGAIEQVRAVAGAAALAAPPDPSETEIAIEEGESAFRVDPELEFDRESLNEALAGEDREGDPFHDLDVEREEDLADIQLRDEEALLREAEAAGPAIEAATPNEIEIDFDPDETEREPDPSVLDFDRVGEPEPAPEPERFAVEPNWVSARRESLAGDRAVDDDGPRRPVLVPVAITLLLGLFVGFLAGYLVGSRDEGPSFEQTGGAAESLPAEEATRSPAATAGEAPSRRPAERSPADPAPAAVPPAPRTEAPSQAAAPPGPAPRSRLVVRSNPTGAQVYVDGRRRGTTPFTLTPLPPGTYTVRVARSGYQEQTQRVSLPAGGTRDVTFRLTRPPARAPARRAAAPQTYTGSIYVDSRPRGATVFLDGREVGNTPLQLAEIRAGSHVVRLELPGHRTWTTSTRVVASQVARVTGSLEPRP